MAAAPRSTEPRTVCVIVNPTAGGRHGDDAADELRELFAKQAAQVNVAVARDGDNVKAIAREAVQRGDALLVVAGGDGTLGAAASVLAGTQTALGIIPFGTFNHFAKDLGFPWTCRPRRKPRWAVAGARWTWAK
jgi:diacylglycerol kinase family enzyme